VMVAMHSNVEKTQCISCVLYLAYKSMGDQRAIDSLEEMFQEMDHPIPG
jgi:hypothetical protein